MLSRYLWRHNNVLKIILELLQNSISYRNKSIQIFSDLKGLLVCGGTIPPSIISTSQKPDIVVLEPSTKKITIIELTVPFETNIDTAHARKVDKYASLVNDIRDAGYHCSSIMIEVGSRGLITKDNRARLEDIIKKLKCDCKYAKLRDDITKSVLTSSYSIFCARKEPEWNLNDVCEF